MRRGDDSHHGCFVPVPVEFSPRHEANVPAQRMTTPAKLRQHVRYVNLADGTRIAWAEAGTGPLVVKAASDHGFSG